MIFFVYYHKINMTCNKEDSSFVSNKIMHVDAMAFICNRMPQLSIVCDESAICDKIGCVICTTNKKKKTYSSFSFDEFDIPKREKEKSPIKNNKRSFDDTTTDMNMDNDNFVSDGKSETIIPYYDTQKYFIENGIVPPLKKQSFNSEIIYY